MDRQDHLADFSQENAMRPALIWQSFAKRMYCATGAVRRFFGPLQPDDMSAPKGLHAPFCVSYGRAVFCFHIPQQRPQWQVRAGDAPEDSTRRQI
jgi:hypothetical protein